MRSGIASGRAGRCGAWREPTGGFAYDPGAGDISLGDYRIEVDTADRAAVELSQAMYLDPREVDKR